MATLYYNGTSFNNSANFFTDAAGTVGAGRVPTTGDTVYLVDSSMPSDTAGDVLTCDAFYGSDDQLQFAFAWFANATFNVPSVNSLNSYWQTGATINGTFYPVGLNPQSPTISASGTLDLAAIVSFPGSYQASDLMGTVVYGRITGAFGANDVYSATADAVADPSDVRDTATNLGVAGEYEAPADSDVRLGVGSGTLVVPTLANTKIGVAGDGGNGTYDGSDRHTDPGQANVRNGTAYKSNSTTSNKTGILVIPAAANVRDGVVYDGATEGLLDLPPEEDVKVGVEFDNHTKTGSAPTLSVEVSTP